MEELASIDLAEYGLSDYAYGFHYFTDDNGNITHSYTTEAGMAFNVKLVKGSKDFEYDRQ